jgi:hypothetical protein
MCIFYAKPRRNLRRGFATKEKSLDQRRSHAQLRLTSPQRKTNESILHLRPRICAPRIVLAARVKNKLFDVSLRRNHAQLRMASPQGLPKMYCPARSAGLVFSSPPAA